MHLSPDTEAVLSYLDQAVEGGLRKRNDVGAILELSATHDQADLFNDLARTGTGMFRVFTTLRKRSPGSEGYPLLEREFGELINETRELLARLIAFADDETAIRFDDIYFGMTQGVVRNLVDLGHDLARIKALQNG